MTETRLTTVDSDWVQLIRERQAALEQVQSDLVELERLLADKLREIHIFEFELRARVRPLLNRLERLEEEIKEYRARLRRERSVAPGDEWAAWSFDEDDAASSGDYRYWGKPAAPSAPQFPVVDNQELKRLFRQLARRFHPDMALDEEDRAYRTGIMMAINAAYASGDLDRLLEIALEPDGNKRVKHAQTDEQLAEALLHEIERCLRRINEVNSELEAAEAHEHSRLMRRVQAAAAEGIDLLARIVQQLRDEISHKMVERDILKAEVEVMPEAGAEVGEGELAYVVWDTRVEEAYDDDLEDQIAERIRRRQSRFHSDDDILDDIDSFS